MTSQREKLSQHILHQLETASEDDLFRVIRALEAKRNSSENPLTDMSLTGSMTLAVPHGEPRSSLTSEVGTEPADVAEDAPVLEVATAGGRRRIAISAAPVQLTKLQGFVPRIIEKTPEEEQLVRQGLEASSLFSAMEHDATNTIIGAMAKEEFLAGVEILSQGKATTNKFYLIVEGQVVVIKNGKQLATMGQGQTFGELEMMYEVTECAATIRTVTPATFFSLDKETYQNVVLQVSVEKRKLYMKLLSSVSFLQGIADYELMTIAEALVPAKYASGDYLIHFGEAGSWMHIIIEGTVQVVGREMGKKKDIIQLGPGNPIGELEFLFNQPTIADVVAITPVKTAKISRRHFEMFMGPISDQLKTFVKRAGKYDYFLSAASEQVKRDLVEVEKRSTKRKANSQIVDLSDFDDKGEIVVKVSSAPAEASSRRQDAGGISLRFPLRLESSTTAFVVLREDGNIFHWNSVMERLTGYAEEEVFGQAIQGFLSSAEGENNQHVELNEAITQAVKWSGNAEGFFESEMGSVEHVYTFSRSDGLTTSSVAFRVVPSSGAQGQGKSEFVLAIGSERKRKPPQRTMDQTQWIIDRINESLSGPEDQLKPTIISAVEKLKSFQRAGGQSVDDLRIVHVRQLIGQTTLAVSAKALERCHTIHLDIQDLLPDNLYLDSVILPDAMKFALSNAVVHTWASTIDIKAARVDVMGMEYLEISFCDSAGLLEDAQVKRFYSKTPENPGKLWKARQAIESIGGEMLIEVKRKQFTKVTLRVPLLEVEITAEESAEIDHLRSSTCNKSMANFAKKRTFTSLVVEERANHKNALCNLLWERKHAVVPGSRWSDVTRLIDSADILFIDPQEACIVEDPSAVDPLSFLRSKVQSLAIVVTADSFDKATQTAYQAAGFFTLTKPFSAMQVISVLRKAEEKMTLVKAEFERIAQAREAVNRTNRGEWRKGRQLGKGAFGEVYEAFDILTGGTMAVKMINVTPKLNKQELINEIEVMCKLQHRNIIHYFYCEDKVEENKIYVFMEFAADGTVADWLKRQQTVKLADIVKILKDIVEGVAYIHQQRFVHCDLKTANVLMSNGICKIGDFGTAKRLQPGEKLFVMQGTPMYMAPECMGADEEEGLGYDFAADIWSLGVILMEMATNKPPFSHLAACGSSMGLMRYITELKTDTPDLTPLFDMDPSIIEFVGACCKIDPSKRPTAEELKSFSIFREGDQDMASAMKALQRAQLWHKLSQFVAFQDEDEIEAERKRKEEEINKKKPPRRDSAFFDSESDGGSDFFKDSDDEEEEDEPEAPATLNAAKDRPTEVKPGETDSPSRGATVPRPNSEREEKPSSTEPELPKAAFPSLLDDGKALDSQSVPTPLIPHPPPNQSPGFVRPPRIESAAESEDPQSMITLHDALVQLAAELQKAGYVDVPFRDELRSQYDEALNSGSEKFVSDTAKLLNSDKLFVIKVVEQLKQRAAT